MLNIFSKSTKYSDVVKLEISVVLIRDLKIRQKPFVNDRLQWRDDISFSDDTEIMKAIISDIIALPSMSQSQTWDIIT